MEFCFFWISFLKCPLPNLFFCWKLIGFEGSGFFIINERWFVYFFISSIVASFSIIFYFHQISWSPGLQHSTYLFCLYASRYIIIYTLSFYGGSISHYNSIVYYGLFMVSLSLASLKCPSAIEQLLHIFLFILSWILLNLGSGPVFILNRFKGKTSFSIQCSIFSSAFTGFYTFSLSKSCLDCVLICNLFPFISCITPKSNTIRLISNFNILEGVILGNPFLGFEY